MEILATCLSIISAIGVIVSILVTLRKSKKESTDEIKTATIDETTLKSDVDYIKRRVDDTLLSQKELLLKVDGLNERVIRVEESVKSAHKRIDGLE